ncbi:MAG TPA: 1-phosphofructokinase family hexose kinase [Steroidobacteraceae bacterium]|nr:1-phosphofructokinase family hexose kinase [Steroidobacteraceae bacterium]
MIVCVSANPAIDRRMHLARLEVGGVNRADTVIAEAGGKAAHVALAAQRLGAPVTWIGLVGGATGTQCEQGLAALGVEVVAVPTRGSTRINLEIIDASGTTTEIREPGEAAAATEIEALVSTVDAVLRSQRDPVELVLSGSLPPGAPHDLYATLTRAARSRGARIWLDASDAALVSALESSPDCVKPNREEAARALGKPIDSLQAAADAARWMLDRGARRAAVSLGPDGLVLRDASSGRSLIAKPPVMQGSAVGSGDATVAGFAVAAARGLDIEEGLRLAVACGAANCRAGSPGMIDPREVERILPEVRLAPLDATWKH